MYIIPSPDRYRVLYTLHKYSHLVNVHARIQTDDTTCLADVCTRSISVQLIQVRERGRRLQPPIRLRITQLHARLPERCNMRTDGLSIYTAPLLGYANASQLSQWLFASGDCSAGSLEISSLSQTSSHIALLNLTNRQLEILITRSYYAPAFD